MKLLLGLLFATTLQISTAQVQDETIIHDFAEVEPQFPGGEEAMMKYIQDNIKYPDAAIAQNLQGIVYVQFIVYSDGKHAATKVVRGAHQLLDDEAVRVINQMPDWTPGEVQGEKVNVRYTLPIHFKMADDPTLEAPVIIKTEKEIKADKKAAKKKEKK